MYHLMVNILQFSFFYGDFGRGEGRRRFEMVAGGGLKELGDGEEGGVVV